MRDAGEKEGGENNLNFLNQLVVSLEQAEIKLEQAYKHKRPNQFNAIKQFMIKLNKRILEGIEE